ncbi:unnamed protein product [Phytophthora lilii]|uniref:Unnamed protein product n=1 Tax=Phytophthora lilii TaxID=2077276 RepID=A0A9W6TBV2_9STRA|nr:unnamed protein product [Phytophthora lilii]
MEDAAQISQADIIERQAQALARLERQARRGAEYKQLTKSKPKEAAQRLRDYRLRVEALTREAAALRRQLRDEQRAHEKARQALKRATPTRHAATQSTSSTVTRPSQTSLSGDVVNRRTTADCGVQTEMDTWLSRKRGRDQVATQTGDQFVPKLTRHVELAHETKDAEKTIGELLQEQEPLQLQFTTFPHETSAALDAELAFSEEEESGETMEVGSGEDAVVAASGVSGKDAGGGTEAALKEVGGFDPTVLSEIDKELTTSSGEEDGGDHDGAGVSGKVKDAATSANKAAVDAATAPKAVHVDTSHSAAMPLLDPDVANEIDKDLQTSSDEEDDESRDADAIVGKGQKSDARSGGQAVAEATSSRTDAPKKSGASLSLVHKLDPAILNAIDADLATSSDEEVGTQKSKTNANENLTRTNSPSSSQRKHILMSIDDELDDELANLESDSEPKQHEKTNVSGNKENEGFSSSSSSSDSDSSDSSDSDSVEDVDDPMAGNADKKQVSLATDEAGAQSSSLPTPLAPTQGTEMAPLELNALKGGTKATVESDHDQRASFSFTTDNDAVVFTTPDKRKPVTTTDAVYSPAVEAELSSQMPEPLKLTTGANTMNRANDHQPHKIVVTKPSIIHPDTSTQTEKMGNAGEDKIAAAGASDVTSSSAPFSSKQLPLVTLSTELEMNTTTNPSSNIDPQPRISTATTAEPGELADPQTPDRPTLTAEITDNVSLTENSVTGKPRKLDEAKLGETQATPQKKIKVAAIAESEQEDKTLLTGANTDSKKTKKANSAAKAETKEELKIKKSISVFKQTIVLEKGEEADNEYARRTISVLASQSSKFIDTHLPHVVSSCNDTTWIRELTDYGSIILQKALCQTLADAFRQLEISPMTVVRGALGVFRTPRSRRLLQDSKLGLSWLCNQVLITLMSSGDAAKTMDISATPNTLTLSLVDECLEHLRGLLVEERTNIGDFLPTSKVQVQAAARPIIVSHDKVFLAHICALHTHLCRSTGQLTRSRVLLFDLLRDNPNIRGLYFAMGMLEIYPAVLEREFDEHCVERQLVLKETLQQVLVTISCVAAEQQELLLHQSSVTMLHRIADAIQMPELEQANGADPEFSRSCVEKLFDRLVTCCQSLRAGQKKQEHSGTATSFFELAKSLEVCAAVFGPDLITEIFSIERCQELLSSANAQIKCGVISVIGHIAKAIAPKTNDAKNPRTLSEQYVENVINWLHHILLTETTGDKTLDDGFKQLVTCSSVCVELILDYSAAAGLEKRRRVLSAVVSWFDATQSDQLVGLPASFLRRLRLAVVAARPQMAQLAV